MIRFACWLGRPASLVVSHGTGDEGDEYAQYLTRLANTMDVRLIFASDVFEYAAEIRSDGRKVYSLADAYVASDLVTYPSRVEGFGNAFLETIYYRKPIMVNNYSIYSHDIKPKGFDVIEMDNFISTHTVKYTKKILNNPVRMKEMAEKNYALGLKYFSYTILEAKLYHLLTNFWGKSITKSFHGDTFLRKS